LLRSYVETVAFCLGAHSRTIGARNGLKIIWFVRKRRKLSRKRLKKSIELHNLSSSSIVDHYFHFVSSSRRLSILQYCHDDVEIKSLLVSLSLLLLSRQVVLSLANVGADFSNQGQEEICIDKRPEGVANGFGYAELLIGQIVSGEILSVNVLTGFQHTVVKPSDIGKRQAWGLEYAPEFGAIVVAGGGPNFGGGKPEVYVYSALSGKLKSTCAPSSTGSFGSFLNDVTVIGDMAYITDSQNDSVMTLDVKAAMQGDCQVGSIVLPAVFDALDTGDFGANGIAAYNDGILVGHEFDASLWYINIADPSNPAQQVLADGAVPGADGLIVDINKLYVTLNARDEIAVFDLNLTDEFGTVEAIVNGCYKSADFEAPSTSAIVKNYIYTANSRFFNWPEPGDPNQPKNTVIGIPLEDILVACTLP
jgi:hypothetical protein